MTLSTRSVVHSDGGRVTISHRQSWPRVLVCLVLEIALPVPGVRSSLLDATTYSRPFLDFHFQVVLHFITLGVSLYSAFSARGRQLSAQLTSTASATNLYISQPASDRFDYKCTTSGVGSAARDTLSFEKPSSLKVIVGCLIGNNQKLLAFLQVIMRRGATSWLPIASW